MTIEKLTIISFLSKKKYKIEMATYLVKLRFSAKEYTSVSRNDRQKGKRELISLIRKIKAHINRDPNAIIDISIEYTPEVAAHIKDMFYKTGAHPFMSIPLFPYFYGDPNMNSDINAYLRGDKNTDPNVILAKDWRYENPMIIRKKTAQDPHYIYAGYLGTFQQSERPYTSMSHLRKSEGKVLSSSFVKDSKGAPQLILDDKTGKNVKIIPISRYAIDQLSGTYYKKEEKKSYCGTFYFWEPDSNVYLELGNSMYANNKFDALFQLDKYDKKENDIYDAYLYAYALLYLKKILQLNLLDDKFIEEFDPKTFHESKKANHFIKELLKLFESGNSEYFEMDDMYYTLAEKKYVGNKFDAFEDGLDQILCKVAKAKGIDTIILSKMPASRRINTEILDTRSREESLNSLVWQVI